MKTTFPLLLILALACFSCSNKKTAKKKGIQVREITENEEGEKIVGLPIDSLQFKTKPRNVLLTKHPAHRLSPIYRVNYTKRTKKPYIGSNAFYGTYDYYGDYDSDNWRYNFMPGFEAMYGHDLVNISHYNNQTDTQHLFFDRPVLIKTLYYPAYSQDSLDNKPLTRDYYMVSVYDEDTNNDGYLNSRDLRRLYHFDLEAQQQTPLIPKTYGVMRSEYDPANDFMYIFARLDENQDGRTVYEEPTHIFWIDLKNPQNVGVQYRAE
ncbi:MAG: hypothetical protein AAFV07_17210 [Bacteroidota bacterium]